MNIRRWLLRGGLALSVAVLVAALAACSAPVAGPETAAVAPPSPTATREDPTPTPALAPARTQEPSIPDEPTATPFVARGDDPAFAPVIFFSTDPDAGTHQRVFPFGVDEVFATWEYRNMREGVTVRREWLLEDQVWLVREEAWDIATYGADGTMRDVSLFDRLDGLGPGHYTLRLYIDGAPQFRDNDWLPESGLLILDPRRTYQYPSPGSDERVAIIQPPGTLLVKDCESCQGQAMVTVPELADVAWFPDSQHLVYTVTDRSEQTVGFSTINLHYELWILDAASGQTRQLSDRRETFWGPIVSPDGRTVAAMRGSGWCDAGECDLGLVFLKLDADLQRVETVQLDTFDFGAADPGGVSKFPIGQADLPIPGRWQSPMLFESAIVQTLGETLNGIYLLDLTTLKATKTGERIIPGSSGPP